MTQQLRNNNAESTQFSNWLRHQPEIDSWKGFRATDIDYVWLNDNTGEWMLIEEKRRMAEITTSQRRIFRILNWCARKASGFRGWYLIQFENTSPDDGRIYLNEIEVSRDELIEFLRFERYPQ